MFPLHTILSFVLENIRLLLKRRSFKVVEKQGKYQEGRSQFSGLWFREVW
jgi:hypothetical protein